MTKTIFESDVGSVIIGGTDYTGDVREIAISAGQAIATTKIAAVRDRQAEVANLST